MVKDKWQYRSITIFWWKVIRFHLIVTFTTCQCFKQKQNNKKKAGRYEKFILLLRIMKCYENIFLVSINSCGKINAVHVSLKHTIFSIYLSLLNRCLFFSFLYVVFFSVFVCVCVCVRIHVLVQGRCFWARLLSARLKKDPQILRKSFGVLKILPIILWILY